MAYAAVKSTKMGLEKQEQTHKIRITLSSKNVENLEKVCSDLVRAAKDKTLRVEGPVTIPTKVLHITARSPCGEGTNTWGRFELRVHKRVIDLFGSPDVVKQITSIPIEPGVKVEVTIADPLYDLLLLPVLKTISSMFTCSSLKKLLALNATLVKTCILSLALISLLLFCMTYLN